MCKEFIANFNKYQMESLSEKLKHNNFWKESGEVLAEVTINILDIL